MSTSAYYIQNKNYCYSKERVSKEELSSYEDLANEKWKGKILVDPLQMLTIKL